MASSFGSETLHWINSQADRWYQTAMIDSGFYEGMYHTFIPTEEEKQRSKGMENMGWWWFNWLEGRIKAFAKVVYQFFTRAALLLNWVPYMLILLIPAIHDGMMTWKIKRTNFDYASPIIHRYGARCTGYIVLALAIAFFTPIALNPNIIPMVMMVSCVLIGITLGNMQKRV